jgi:hypothetical protein
MRRVTDFRVGELRIPAERFPLPARVEELLRIYYRLGSVGRICTRAGQRGDL